MQAKDQVDRLPPMAISGQPGAAAPNPPENENILKTKVFLNFLDPKIGIGGVPGQRRQSWQFVRCCQKSRHFEQSWYFILPENCRPFPQKLNGEFLHDVGGWLDGAAKFTYSPTAPARRRRMVKNRKWKQFGAGEFTDEVTE